MPEPAFTAEAKAAFIDAIENGSGRIDAAHEQQVKLATVEAAINADPEFRRLLELAEQVRVHDSLIEAATSGNVPAIESFMRRSSHADAPPPAPHGAIADVQRLAGQMKHLIDGSK